MSILSASARAGRVTPLPDAARPLVVAMNARGLSDHGLQVAVLSAAVCRHRRIGLPAARVIARAALFHDVGKLAIPAEVLDSPHGLAARDMELLRTHPAVGERMLRRIPGLESVATLVRHSHERWDGRGYPDGLRRRAIPLGARIIAACDTWDAMRSDRPYSPPRPVEESLDALLASAGSQHDPAVVATLVEVLETEGLC